MDQLSINSILQSIAAVDFPDISINLTFNISSPTQSVMLPILNDMAVEDFEYFSLALMSSDPDVVDKPNDGGLFIVGWLQLTLS